MFATRTSAKFIRVVLSLAITLLTIGVLTHPQQSAQAVDLYTLTTCNASELVNVWNTAISTATSDIIVLKAGCTYSMTATSAISGGNRALATLPATSTAGGVVHCAGSTVCSVSSSYFTGNTAATGGALYSASASQVYMYKSRMSSNTATSFGGAITVGNNTSLDLDDTTLDFNTAKIYGGAILCYQCVVYMSNNTLHDNDADSDNSGDGDGGALAMLGSFTTLPDIDNTVFHDNEDLNGPAASFRSDISGSVDTGSINNFVSVNTGLTGITNANNGNRVGTSSAPLDPLLGPYKTRPGGLFGTRAPLPNSPLINAGENASVNPFSNLDSRGVRRILYTTVDIGAVEFKRADAPVVVNPANQGWLFRNSATTGPVEMSFLYGQGLTDYGPLVGDWNGDGIDTQGVYTRFNANNIGVFALSNAFNSFDAVTLPAFVFTDANPNWIAVKGNWDNSGGESVGAYRVTGGLWVLTNNNTSSTPSYASFAFGGGLGIVPLAGDWDGNGSDGIGLFNYNNSRWYLSNDVASGGFVNTEFQYSDPGSYPMVGDWDGDGIDTPGLYNPTTGQWLLRNSNTTGPADIAFVYGQGSGLIGRAGQWKTVLPGDGTSPIRELAATPVSPVSTPDAPQIAPTFAP